MKDFLPVRCAEVLHHAGLLVRQARLQQGLRQVDLGARAGTSLRTVRRIEAGDVDGISLRDFMMILWVLGISDRAFSGLVTEKAAALGLEPVASKKRVRVRSLKAEDF